MSITQSSHEIDGKKFFITTLGASDGKRVLVRLAGALGGPLATLIGSSKPNGRAVANAVLDLSSSVGIDELEYFCDVFGRHTEIENFETKKRVVLTSEVQNIVFAGKYDLMFKWLKVCFEVNFRPLLSMLSSVTKNQ